MDWIANRRNAASRERAFRDPVGRDVELPVYSTDPLIVARFVAFVVIALFTYSFADGTASDQLALIVLCAAFLQPLLPFLGRSQASYRHAQVISDLIIFSVGVLIAPEYFWLSVAVAASLVGNYAVLTPMRRYVPVAVLAVATVAVLGSILEISDYQRAVGIVGILAVGHGYMGVRTRRSMGEASTDVLHAIRAAGGIAHLTDLGSGRIVDVVGDVERIVGWNREQWMSLDHQDLIHPDDLADFWIDFETAASGDLIDRTARFKRPDGEWVWIRDLSRIVMLADRPSLRGFSIDVTAQQDGLARVTSEASTDALTGLPNRRALLGALTKQEGTSGRHLVLIDLDRFKDVNDTLGHDAGDELLEVVAERLTACLRPSDLLARLGGDEFAMIIDGVADTTSVIDAVDRFGIEVARPIEVSGVMVSVSISAGIVSAEADASDPLTMLRHADISMYAAKRSGARSVVFDTELDEQISRQAALAGAFPHALDSGELALQFQPIVDANSGEVAGLEGLARWEHPEFGCLTPASFLDVVLMSEQSGAFTRRMVHHGVEAAVRLAAAGHDISVSINLPVRVLEDPDFGSFVSGVCATRGISPNRLVFEIAERDIHDTASITSAIDRMVAMGTTISVDDFGAGHATFERLRWGNVEQLKLDGEAIRHAVERPRDRSILKSMLDLTAELGYTVVAEGVESEEQLDLLRSLGCPLAQGYLFAAAMPLDDVVAFVGRRRVSVG